MPSKQEYKKSKEKLKNKMRSDLSNLKCEYKVNKKQDKTAKRAMKHKLHMEKKNYIRAKHLIRRYSKDAIIAKKKLYKEGKPLEEEVLTNPALDSTSTVQPSTMVGIAKDGKDFTTCLTGDQSAYLRKVNKLPRYTHGEEIFNSVTHIVGGGFGVLFLIIGVVCAAIYCPSNIKPTAIASMAVFGFCTIFLYTMSAIYHGLHINKAKKVFQIIDHCTIYILISGTYTPICLMELTMIAPYNYVLLGCIYLLAALGVSLNATMMDKFPVKVVSNTLYLVMGWTVIFFYPYLIQSLGIGGTWLLIGGGICYTVGAIFYGLGKNIKYFHSIFHLFVNTGTLLQFLGILLYGIVFPAIGMI